MTDQSCKWYVLRVPFRNELKVRDGMRRSGLRAYVPMHWQVDTVKGRKSRRLVPAIRELVFVHGTDDDISLYKSRCKETVYWMMTGCSGKRDKLVVPDKAMNDFIRITEQSERIVTYFHPEELQMSKGDRILIHGGPFDGVEGMLLKIKGKRDKQLVVSIPSITAVAVSIRPEMVELVSRQVTKSANPSRDAKELIRLSMQMLTASPDKSTQGSEWNMLYNEIQRLYASLHPLKGYLASLEGEMALSLLLAERALGTVTDTTLQRCRTAASRLRPSKLREQLLEELKKNTL